MYAIKIELLEEEEEEDDDDDEDEDEELAYEMVYGLNELDE